MDNISNETIEDLNENNSTHGIDIPTNNEEIPDIDLTPKEVQPPQFYLRTLGENGVNGFEFELEGYNCILPTDIPISLEDHTEFMRLQGQEKQFRLKEIRPQGEGHGLFDYVEEYTPEIVKLPKEPGIEDYLLDIEYRVSKMELGV
jgi:hypothetical protein